MATYKVIQDIEAEDKLLGPLTLRQFIYAAIVIVMGFIAFKLATVNYLLIIPFVLPMGFFGLLAAPFGHDQSSEVWLLAKIRFLLKPRKRIWNQSGLQELVTITVPKKLEQHLTDGLSAIEVKSRLQALANTIDSRGWAVKNVNVNLFSQPSYLTTGDSNSDRLLDASSMPQEVPAYEVYAADDILDEANNPTAQHLKSMVDRSDQAHHQAVLTNLQTGAKPDGDQVPADYWFMHQTDPANIQPGYATFTAPPTVLPGMQTSTENQSTDRGESEQALLQKIHSNKDKPNAGYGHTKVLDPKAHEKKQAQKANNKANIDRLARDNNLNVDTIAREAERSKQQPPDNEVVINLR